MRCEIVREQILDQTLEGAPLPAGPLREHLRHCAACRSFAGRLEEADLALRTLPLETAPSWVSPQVARRIAIEPTPEEPFLPWTLWLPVASLFLGAVWAYVTLLWSGGLSPLVPWAPTIPEWLRQLMAWVRDTQATLSVVGLAIAVGLLFTFLAVGLGFYVGRERVVHSH